MSGHDESFADFAAVLDADGAEVLTLGLDGFEGPLDLLLDLARRQKVDLLRIALVPLVDHYLQYIERAAGRMDLAAEYLVMAAWLALLKSRLLLPKAERPQDEPDADALAERLRTKLMRLDEARAAAKALWDLPQMERDVWPFGKPTATVVSTTPVWTDSLHDLLTAYCAGRARSIRPQHRVAVRRVYTLEAARRLLEEALALLDDWRPLTALAPKPDRGPGAPASASYTASLFGAALELVRDQKLDARQSEQFAPLMLRRRSS